MADVFVSYSRSDAGFVRELHAFLTGEKREVWVDWEDIRPASKWEQDIDDSIDAAESFVFVASQASLASEYCAAELRHAEERGKRIVPLAIDGASPEDAPPALRELNWIWCRASDDRDAAFAALTSALDTDLDWSRAHTRLLVRAVEWDGRGDASLLLRGKDLEQAERDLAENAGKEPRPTELQQRYLHASRRAATRRQRALLGGVTVALGVAVVLAIVALLQRNTANERARVARSQALAAQAEQSLATAPAAGLRDALAAMRTQRTQEARGALRDALLANPVTAVVPAPKKPPSSGARSDALTFGDEGRVLVGLTPDARLHVWGADGTEIAPTRHATRASVSPNGDRVLYADDRLVRVEPLGRPGSGSARRLGPDEHAAASGFAGATPLVLAVGGSAGARIVDVGTGRSVVLERPDLRIAHGVWSADGSTVVTAGARTRVWDARTGRLRATLPTASAVAVNRNGTAVATHERGSSGTLWSLSAARPHAHPIGAGVSTIAFSPDGKIVAAVGPTGTATLWRAADGKRLGGFPGFGGFHSAPNMIATAEEFDPAAAFSPDGRLVAVAAADRKVRLFDRTSGKVLATIAAGWVNALAFAPNGGRVAAMSWDSATLLARTPGIRLASDLNLCAWAPIVSPDGRRVLAANGDRSVSLSDTRGTLQAELSPPIVGVAAPHAPVFSSDGSTVAVSTAKCVNLSSNEDRYGTAVWRTGTRAPVLQLPNLSGSVLLDRAGSVLVLNNLARQVPSGRRLPRLDGVAAFSPDGRRAVRLRRGTLQVVRVPSGAPIATLTSGIPRDATVTASFNSDGSRLLASRDDGDGPTSLWNAATGRRIARIGSPGTVAFTDRGRRIVALFDRRIRTYRSNDGSVASTLSAAIDDPNASPLEGKSSAISANGKLVALAGDEGQIDLIDVTTGLHTTIQTPSAETLASIAFVPGHDLFATWDATGAAYLVPCNACATDDVLLARGRATLERVSRVSSRHPSMFATIP